MEGGLRHLTNAANGLQEPEIKINMIEVGAVFSQVLKLPI